MNKSFIIALILIFTSITCTLYAGVSDFKKIIEDYLSVNNIKASISQHIYLENGTTEVFAGNYFASTGGFIRIDYLRPESQTIVINDSGLFWYYNERKILFLSEKKGADRGSIPSLMNVIPSESINDIEVVSEGKKFYSIFRIADAYSITSKITSKKNKSKIIIWIDPVLKIIKRKYMTDESGREIIREDYVGHTLVNGIYIPSKIELKGRTPGGVVHTMTEYSGIVINSRVDKDLFNFKITPDMKVRSFSEQ